MADVLTKKRRQVRFTTKTIDADMNNVPPLVGIRSVGGRRAQCRIPTAVVVRTSEGAVEDEAGGVAGLDTRHRLMLKLEVTRNRRSVLKQDYRRRLGGKNGPKRREGTGDPKMKPPPSQSASVEES